MCDVAAADRLVQHADRDAQVVRRLLHREQVGAAGVADLLVRLLGRRALRADDVDVGADRQPAGEQAVWPVELHLDLTNGVFLIGGLHLAFGCLESGSR
jgi:hypothetical protein